MGKTAKKWLLWGSISLLILAIAGVVWAASIHSILGDQMLILSSVFVSLSVLNLIFLFSTKYQNHKIFRKVVKLFTFSLPFFILFLYAFDTKWLSKLPDFIYGACIIIILVLILFALVYIYILNDIRSIFGIAVIIFYATLTLILNRLNIGDQESHIVFSFVLMGFGMYLFGLRCLIAIEKNRFLKIASFIACLVIFFGSFSMLFFFSTEADITVIIYSISVFVITLVVLLSIPVAGYINWDLMHKKILKKILIPWIFFLLIISVRFIFPDLNELFFHVKEEPIPEFSLYDYAIKNFNGLEPE